MMVIQLWNAYDRKDNGVVKLWDQLFSPNNREMAHQYHFSLIFWRLWISCGDLDENNGIQWPQHLVFRNNQQNENLTEHLKLPFSSISYLIANYEAQPMSLTL